MEEFPYLSSAITEGPKQGAFRRPALRPSPARVLSSSSISIQSTTSFQRNLPSSPERIRYYEPCFKARHPPSCHGLFIELQKHSHQADKSPKGLYTPKLCRNSCNNNFPFYYFALR
ncbi:hypothetical protein H6P81_012685 [Aristolochia fimbriata]|uniref:Uncharacterized protein n=1 Tax=Aristolochia fimbriata TaxID=158543 RepID=A0AAV7ECJ0_ARIFI|nr:hypothetical protein H6P81_012685 [Aristolochia fimbriata]